jgi:hypothetical protein
VVSREKVTTPRHRLSFERLDMRTPVTMPALNSAIEPPPVRRRLTGRRADLLALAGYLVLALWTTARLWAHVHSRVLGRNPGDHTLFQWMLAYGARFTTHGGNPFLTDRLGVPDTVNVAANTNILGLSVPLAPVTLLFGPDVSFAVLVTLAFTLTAFGWYHVFSRYLVDSRLAALVGGGFCGFAPALVAHANGQPNQVAQFVVPYLVLFTLRLHRRPVRNGIALGLLAAYQTFVNEEILFIAAMALGLLVALYAVQRRAEVRQLWRPFLAGLAVATGTGLVLLAYPLYVQFSGPGSYHGLPFRPDRYVSDVLSFVTYPRQSLGGDPSVAAHLSPSPDEDNSSFGWPLVALALVLAAWLWRRALVRAAVITAVVMAVLSLGPTVRFHGHGTPVPAPFALVQHIPPFTFAVPGRFAMVAVPVIGMLLAVGVDLMGQVVRPARYARHLRLLFVAALVGALIPLVPMPLYVAHRAAVPRFVSSGEWRAYVPPGRAVVTVPLPSYQAPDPMYWQAAAGLDFPVPRGYYLGPTGPADRAAMFGAPPRPTATLLYAISVLPKVPKPSVGGDTPLGTLVTPKSDPPVTITGADRDRAVEDLRYWRAAIVILAPQRNADRLRATLTDLLGYPPRWVDGVWLWDVRQIGS